LDAQTAARSITRMALRMGVDEVSRFLGSAKMNNVIKQKVQNRTGRQLFVDWKYTGVNGTELMVEFKTLKKSLKLEEVLQQWGTQIPMLEALKLFQAKIGSLTNHGKTNKSMKIMTFTEYNVVQDNGLKIKYKAHPYWKKQGWHDWAFVHVKGVGRKKNAPLVPHHLLLLFEITGMDDDNNNGRYAFAQRTMRDELFCKNRETKWYNYYGIDYQATLDGNSHFVVWDAKQSVEQREGVLLDDLPDTVTHPVRTISVKNIKAPLIGVHDPYSNVPGTYLFVEARKVWEEKFMEYAKYVNGQTRIDRKKEREAEEAKNNEEHQSETEIEEPSTKRKR